MERVLEEAKLAVLQLPSEIAMAMVAGQFVGRRGSDLVRFFQLPLVDLGGQGFQFFAHSSHRQLAHAAFVPLPFFAMHDQPPHPPPPASAAPPPSPPPRFPPDTVASRGASRPVGYSRKCPCDCGVAVPASTPAVSLAVASPCRSSSCHGRPRTPLAPTGIAGSGPAPLREPWSDLDGCRQTHDGQSANHPS